MDMNAQIVGMPSMIFRLLRTETSQQPGLAHPAEKILFG